MKYLVIILLAVIIVSSTVDAQSKSPVNTAHEIYESCMGGYYLAANIKPTKADIKKFVDDANEQCLGWMVVWYKPLTGHVMKITEWDDLNMGRLNTLITKTMHNMNMEIRFQLGVK